MTGPRANTATTLSAPRPSGGPGQSGASVGALIPRARIGLSYVVVPILLILSWQALVATGWVNRNLIPAPSDILSAWGVWFFGAAAEQNVIGTVAFSGTGLASVLASAERVLIGFGLSAVIATLLGIAIGEWTVVRRIIDPTLQFFRPIPVTAWIPFSIIVFGIRDGSAIFLVFLAAFFPILLNSTSAVRNIPLNYIRAARMLGARQDQILFRVVLPAAMPGVLTGMRIGLGVAWTSVIVAEMLAVKSGVGYVLWNSYFLFRMDQLGAAMLTMGILGLSSDLAMQWLTNRLIGWSQR